MLQAQVVGGRSPSFVPLAVPPVLSALSERQECAHAGAPKRYPLPASAQFRGVECEDSCLVVQGEFMRASRECVGERNALAEVVVVVEVTGTEVGCEGGEPKACGVDCLEVWSCELYGGVL